MSRVEPGDRVVSLGQIMRVDSVTAEVVSRLAARGIRTILLKGPSLGRWLYDDKAERPYADTDLLVSPRQADELAGVLRDLGFEVAIPRHELDRPVPAVNWIRRRGGAAVDVHVGLTGARAHNEDQWDVLSRKTDVMSVAGVEVEVLTVPGRALHAVLHLAQHGRELRPLRDVERALERVPLETWRDAAAMAARLDALPAFAGGLGLVPGGPALSERLGLTAPPSIEVILREEQVPLALGLQWMRELTMTGRLELIRAKLFPPPRQLVPDPARRSLLALLRAYARNLLRMTKLLVPAWRALRRARRRAAAEAGPPAPRKPSNPRKPDELDTPPDDDA